MATTQHVESDSGVFVNADGYERIMTLAGWDRSNWNRLARLHVRVDRVPVHSFAKVELESHLDPTQWDAIIRWNPDEWWHSVPGYERAANRRASTATLSIVSHLMAKLAVFNNQEKTR